MSTISLHFILIVPRAMLTTALYVLCHDQDTIHAEKGCEEMCNFRMTVLMSLTGHEIKARTHTHGEMAQFPTWRIIRTWKALGLWPCASGLG